MPIYEYVCQDCTLQFEELVAASKSHLKVACPQCGSRKVERRLSVFAARQGERSSSNDVPPNPCARCGEAGASCPLAQER